MNAVKINKILGRETLHQKDINNVLKLPREYQSKGFIYVLSNPSMDGIYKIGMTVRDVEQRVKELSKSTSIPTPFNIEIVFHSDAPYEDEQRIHSLLSKFRISDSREFFKCELREIVNICREITQSFVVGEDLSMPAMTNDVISLSSELNLIDTCELYPLLKDISYTGNEVEILNLLCELGANVLCDFVKNNKVAVVIMPDGKIEFVKPYEYQFDQENNDE